MDVEKKTFVLRQDQVAFIKEMAAAQHRSEGAIVRQIVDEKMRRYEAAKRR